MNKLLFLCILSALVGCFAIYFPAFIYHKFLGNKTKITVSSLRAGLTAIFGIGVSHIINYFTGIFNAISNLLSIDAIYSLNIVLLSLLFVIMPLFLYLGKKVDKRFGLQENLRS